LFELVDARFQFCKIFQAGFELVQRIDDAGKTLIVLLSPEARLHPAKESPNCENEHPKFHGASGPGSVGHVFDRESLQGGPWSQENNGAAIPG
jgi:hypothetical protein